MSRTAVIFSPIYYRHNTGRNHPESAQRLRAIFKELEKSKPSKNGNWQFVHPEKASIDHVQLVHTIEYIKLVEAVCKSGGGLLDLEDTVVSRESFDVALYAVGGTLKAIDLVMEKKFTNAFAVVRPPGHHAGKFRACGFCIFNNVAIAAEYLIRKFNMKKVVILDIDAHHGNGTQEVFYKTPKVLYISLHEDPRSFPRTGFISEIGKGEGLGYNINVPLPFQTSDQIFLRALDEIVKPIMRQYKPQFMLVSAGLDGHYTDPIGNLSLSAICYEKTFKAIVELASETCKEKLVSVLEGGYSPDFVGKIATSAIAQMSGTHYIVNDNAPSTRNRVNLQGEKVIKKVKKVLKPFWDIV
jgi:acetoin utilization deacetylase AcuC-like enzyme